MKKHKEEYDQIDAMCDTLNTEFQQNLTKPKPQKKVKVNEVSKRIQKEKSAIKRRLKAQIKEEQKMIQYIHDRLVIMQIETQSQPSKNLQNQIS